MWNMLVSRVNGIWCIYSLGKECCVVFAVSPIKKCVSMCVYMHVTTTCMCICILIAKILFQTSYLHIFRQMLNLCGL